MFEIKLNVGQQNKIRNDPFRTREDVTPALNYNQKQV